MCRTEPVLDGFGRGACVHEHHLSRVGRGARANRKPEAYDARLGCTSPAPRSPPGTQQWGTMGQGSVAGEKHLDI